MKTIKPSNILLPNQFSDISKWAVIACDQFTSEEKYWKDLEEYVGQSPSALNLIFPEVYLNKIDTKEKIKSINSNMESLLKNNFFIEYKKSFVFVERETEYGKRLGLVACIDLEDYDFDYNKNTLIRATEKTVVERLPIRCKIRENAPLELSHIVLLIDDKEKTILEEINKYKYSFKKIYDFDLNMKGGNIKGYLINDQKEVNNILEKFEKLIKDNLLALVGDGNHSLASAKRHYEALKEKLSYEKSINHSARYALVEIENIYDDAVHFEPIHRLIKNASSDFLINLKEKLKGNFESKVFINGKEEKIYLNENAIIAVKELEDYILEYKKTHDIEVDYIHGEDNLREICKMPSSIGIVMPKMRKEDFFTYIKEYKIMPKKTFSIGEANEKRYYIEARKIK